MEEDEQCLFPKPLDAPNFEHTVHVTWRQTLEGFHNPVPVNSLL